MDTREMLEAGLARFEAMLESLVRTASSTEELRANWIAGCRILDEQTPQAHRKWMDEALFRLHSKLWGSQELAVRIASGSMHGEMAIQPLRRVSEEAYRGYWIRVELTKPQPDGHWTAIIKVIELPYVPSGWEMSVDLPAAENTFASLDEAESYAYRHGQRAIDRLLEFRA